MRTHTGAACAVAAMVGSLAVLHASGAPGRADRTASFALTVDSIMRGPKLVGYPPTGLRWSGDSAHLYFEWRRPGDEEASTWVVGRDGTGLRQMTADERRSAPPAARGAWDAAHRRALFVDAGDVVLVDSVEGTRRSITRTTAEEANPRWAHHETAVTFTRDNNLFLVTLASGGVEQLTDIAPTKREPRETDSQKYVKAEEEKLIEHTRVLEEKKKKEEEEKKARALPKLELQERQSAVDLQLSPDGTHVFVVVVEHAEHARRGIVPNYVTESAYVEDISGRTTVGDAQDRRMLAVMNLETGRTAWADAGFAGAKRMVSWSMPVLSDTDAVTVARARAVDNKDRWLVALDRDSGACRVVDALHDDAWVREPGGFGPNATGSYGWLADNAHVWFLSERDGWMHLYAVDAGTAGAAATQLTSGTWEIEAAVLSGDNKTFYLTTTETHPGERHIYAMAAGGGARTKLTSMTGSNVGPVSPDGDTIGLVYSYSNKPPEVYVMANPAAAAGPADRAGEPRQVTTTPTEEWRSFKWADPQLITYKARDGAEVYARLYTPEMVGARRDSNAPAVVFVHGSGYTQNAHRYWSSYYHEYMFHNLLARRGYVVLDPDYRASAGYGRDWRTAIYRHMGGHDLEDVIDGAKYLVASEKMNPKKIGVYGGSYGGFITLMAMFTSPDTFAAGAALRPVTDWAHYNHSYTSNILNDPQDDAEAYRKSSPIYFADGLKGALLICHGMVDTNVFFQDTVRLVQRLIELRKPNWQLAVYPVENHGFEAETSWADEYTRILSLFDEHLGGRGAAAHTN